MPAACDIDIREACHDPGSMMEKVLNLPEQIEQSHSFLKDVTIRGAAPAQIILLGMGGSAIGGSLIKSQLRYELKIPFEICQSYQIPASVDRNSLVIAVSYSGNTEETLASFEEALAMGAKPVCISSGGTLTARARELGLPCIAIPPGFPPRSALGYLYMSILSVLERLALVESKEHEKSETISQLKHLREGWNPDVPSASNPAKQCAQRLMGKIPVIFGSSERNASVAMRWKCQLNENSKMIGYSNVFPELNHNEIVGWGNHWTEYGNFHAIFLRDRDDSSRIEKRIAFTRQLIEKNATVDEFRSSGESAMARLFSLIYLGDLVSVYLAFLYGVDPTEIKTIDAMKEILTQAE